jgi:hypothetical protein
LQTFIASKHKTLLEQNQLDSFDKAWSYQASWFEEPNNRRGGWSGVGRLVLANAAGKELGVFLKRQENHLRRTFRHPLHGEPTFACEFRMMRYLAARGVPAPEPVFFAQREQDLNSRAILMTEELVHFSPLDEVAEEIFLNGKATLATKRSVLRGVAATVRKLHAVGIQHRSLYPKHLFVKMMADADPEVVVIDLEKSRRKWIAPLRTVYDLATLDRHARYWNRTARLYFFKRYMGIEKLTPWTRFLCRLIYKRSHRPR